MNATSASSIEPAGTGRPVDRQLQVFTNNVRSVTEYDEDAFDMAGDETDTAQSVHHDYLLALRTRIQDLHVHNGEPSVRQIASRTSHAISHTTVHSVLRCQKLPTWGQLELVIEQLSGDVEEFRRLWIAARNAKRGILSGSADLKGAQSGTGRVPELRSTDVSEEGQPRTEVMADLLTVFLDEVERIAAGRPDGIPTGFVDLDRLINGLGPGKLVVLAGLPAIGKSMCALNFARQAAIRQNVGVLLLTFRTSKIEVVARVAAAEARIPLHVLHSGNLMDDDWTKLARRLGEMGESPLFVNDDHDMSISDVVAEARRMVVEHSVGLVIVDSVQDLVNNSQIRVTEAEVSRTLKILALELHIPVVAVSTIPHGPNQQALVPQPPGLQDLHGIEEDADVVITIHRDDSFDPTSPRAGEVDLMVVKHRNGPTDTVTVAAQTHLARFVDIAIFP